MSSSGFIAATFQQAIYLNKYKKRFEFSLKPLLLIHLVVHSAFFIQLGFSDVYFSSSLSAGKLYSFTVLV